VSIDYISAADPDTLEEVSGMASRVLISLAARIGRARLIDNVLLEANEAHTNLRAEGEHVTGH
jgi:pantoate--beta-alanine ligase